MNPNLLGTVNHFNEIKLRIIGSGALNMTLYGPQQVKSKTLPITTLSATRDKEVVKLANFRHTRAQLELTTTVIDEYFELQYILVYYKPVAANLPQG